MAIDLELPRKLQAVIEKAHQGAPRCCARSPASTTWREHAYPVEAGHPGHLFEGISEAKTISFAGAEAFPGGDEATGDEPSTAATCRRCSTRWRSVEGDVALLLVGARYQGLGNAAISSVATDEQLERLGKDVGPRWRSPSPSFGSDSAAVTTTAKLDGDEYVINGEKIFVTAGSRATHIVVWATVGQIAWARRASSRSSCRANIPGVTVERLEHKLGIKASDTAVIRFDNARIPKDNLLGDPEVNVEKGFARGHGDLRQHPAPRGRDGRRHRPRRAGGTAQHPHRGRRRDLLRQARARAERRRPRSSCGWKPTGKPATC